MPGRPALVKTVIIEFDSMFLQLTQVGQIDRHVAAMMKNDFLSLAEMYVKVFPHSK